MHNLRGFSMLVSLFQSIQVTFYNMEIVFSELFKNDLFADVYFTRVCEMRLKDRNLHSEEKII